MVCFERVKSRTKQLAERIRNNGSKFRLPRLLSFEHLFAFVTQTELGRCTGVSVDTSFMAEIP